MATKRKLSAVTSVAGDAKRLRVGHDEKKMKYKQNQNKQKHRTKSSRVYAKTGNAANNVIQQSINDCVPHNKTGVCLTKQTTQHVAKAINSRNSDVKHVSHHKKTKSEKVFKKDMKHKKFNKFRHFKKHKKSTTDIQHSGQKAPNHSQIENSAVNEEKQNCVVIPRKPEEISSNWKKLQQVCCALSVVMLTS